MKFFILFIVACLCFSCIRNEALNAEADIEACVILNAAGHPDENIKGNVILKNNQIIAQATPRINLKKLSLNVRMTPGASITPDPTELKDYSDNQFFTVTSEDGEWEKNYVVSIDTFDLPVKYSFEYVELSSDNKYDVFYEKVESRNVEFQQNIWASGNPGFAITGVAKSKDDYPTVSVMKGQTGNGVRLETKSTGAFGEMVKMPIAAGNLFIGDFIVANATSNARAATRFGLQFGREPVKLVGYYKYKSGDVMTRLDAHGKILKEPGKDECDIYAVLYEAEGLEKETLDGDNVLNSPNIVALARLEKPHVYPMDTDLNSKEYERFEVDFKLLNGKKFDKEKSKNYKYNLAVVFTSSKGGAYFEGAVGSVLYIDEVEVICK